MPSFNVNKETLIPEEEVNWNVVRLLVQKYTERHPEEVNGCKIHVQELRQELKTRFGEWQTEGRTRHIFELPSRLESAISMKYPKALKDENLRRFLSMFPDFQVAEQL